MPLNIGARLGSYEIIGALGAGGMGEVYRARDTKLDRAVAIKVLPESFAHDPERLARFEREAKTLAALNHPNIAIIHGFEEADGIKALVMELVEGPTLADRIARGPISIDEALPIAKQIAEALEAAHEQGIIHRDLKPANIKVRADGTVKVLDFGLAKAMEPTGAQSASASMSPTLSLHATMAGVILGTAAYMAPEQAKGKHVDRRVDVWAFGAVLYEMLAGKRAFTGDDVSDTLVSVLRDEPDWAALPADVPASARQVLRVCLQKDPKKRVRDMSAIRLALDGAFDPPAQAAGATPAVAAPRRALWRQALPWAAGALIVGGLTAGAAVWMRPAPAARVARFVIATPADLPFQVGAASSGVAISPDGSRLIYRLSPGVQGPTTGILYQRELGQLEATPIRGTEGAVGFFVSPDGNWIGFFNAVDNTLKRISVSGGPSQTICAVDGSLRGGSWGPDDTIVFATVNSKGLRRVPAAGGEPQVLTKVDPAKGETDHWWPDVLPDGEGVVFTAWNGTAERSRIVALSLASGSISDVVRGGSQPRFSPTGHLVYGEGGTLRAVRFDAGSLEAVGDPAPIMEGVASATTGAANYAIAADGSLVYVKGGFSTPVSQRTLVWVDRQGRQEAVNVPARAYTYARLSPDGTRVALDARDQQNDIWIWHLARETLQRLTTDPGLNRSPVWTPDGTRVAFTAAPEGGVESIYWQKADGSGVPERLSVGSTIQGPSSFSPDGKRLVFNAPLTPPYDIGMLSLDSERREEMLLKTKFSESGGVVSPDGRWLAYESHESGQSEIYLAPFPNVNASKQQVSTRGGTRPLWSKDGRELFYYVTPDTIMALPVRLGADVVLGILQVVVKGPFAVAVNTGRHYDVSPDGKRFLLLKDAEAAAGARPAPPEIHLVQHWAEELKAKVPEGK